MPRRAEGSWDARTGRYYARLGPVSPKTGRPMSVPLRHPDGTPVAKGDDAGRAAAVARLLADRGVAVDAARERLQGGPTVAEICTAFVAWQHGRKAAERTVAGHHYHLSRFCAARGNGERLASAMTAADLYAFEVAGAKDLRHLILSVHAAFRWASRPIRARGGARLIPTNPFEGIERPPPGSRGEDCVMAWGDVRAVIRAARGWARGRNPRDRRHATTRRMRRLRILCLHLIAVAGCRPSEAWRLRWDEVDWDAGIIAVDAGRDKGRRPGRKPRKPRRFAVPARMLDALRVVRRWDKANPVWVFAPQRRETEPNVREWFRWLREDLKPAVAARNAGLPAGFTSYWLRHSAVSQVIQGGASPDLIGDQFGNSAEVLRGTYSHAADAVRHRTAEDLKRARRRKG